MTIPNALIAVVGQRQPALSEVIDLVFVEYDRCIFMRLSHYSKEQVGDPFVHRGLLLAGRALGAGTGALTGHKNVHDRHWFPGKKGGARCAPLMQVNARR